MTLPSSFSLGQRTLGHGFPVFVIAELSANHRQDLSLAEELVHAAHEAGADAIKLQTYTPDTLTLDSDAEPFRISGGTLWDGATLHQLYGQAQTPWDWHPRLFELAGHLGMEAFSSPFDASAVDFLETLHVPAYKIASFELVDLPLIRRAARTGKPLILSTGMATLAEIQEAVQAAQEAGATALALLKCNSGYPAPPAEMHLRGIQVLQDHFQVPIGLSDHTLETSAATVAVSLGANLLEKHLTLRRADGGPDAAFSLEPAEFKAMIQQVRLAETLLGAPRIGPSLAEQASRRLRRSLFAVADIRKGEGFTPENVRSIRPAHGLHPRHLEQVLSTTAAEDIPRGTPLRDGHLVNPPQKTTECPQEGNPC